MTYLLNNKAYSEPTIFYPFSSPTKVHTLFVLPQSTGTVTHQTMTIIDGVESWSDVLSYAAGEGDTLTQGTNIFRLVPSDETTYFKYG